MGQAPCLYSSSDDSLNDVAAVKYSAGMFIKLTKDGEILPFNINEDHHWSR